MSLLLNRFKKKAAVKSESYYIAGQWQLMRKKFFENKLALIGLFVLSILYLDVIFCEFFAPFDPYERDTQKLYHPTQIIRLVDLDGNLSWPFIYGTTATINMENLSRDYAIDEAQKHYLGFFVKGDPYKLWGIIPATRHFFGISNPAGDDRGGETVRFYLFGTDELGRDMLSRAIYALRISLTIGLLGVAISFVIGVVLGAVSAFYGGVVDNVIQRIIEILISIPTIPLWMALTASLPRGMSPLNIYLGITIILSIIGWTGLARVVRGKLLEVKESDFVMYAKIAGANEWQMIFRHMVPSFMSYLIIYLTLAIPGMILGETSLSFLGLGLQPPVISLGVLLFDAQNFRTVVSAPYLLIPAIFVVISVLAFNFVGDGLRDVADPYSRPGA